MKTLAIILHYNTIGYTDALYEMLKPYERDEYELMVLDNGSQEGKASKYNPQNWLNRSKNPFQNVVEVFKNNPYVDGMIDEVPSNTPIFHDHFRIYDPNNRFIPIAEQILRYWRFDPNIIHDSAPETYWDDEEKKQGDGVITKIFGEKEFGFLYIDDSFYEGPIMQGPSLDIKRQIIQSKINEFDNLPWLYYAGKDINQSHYKTTTKTIDVRSLEVNLRIQNYIKSKSKLIIGHRGGYGTDCMSRYTTCHVIPLMVGETGEHFIRTTKYVPHA